MSNKFSCSTDNFILKTKNDKYIKIKYIYYYLKKKFAFNRKWIQRNYNKTYIKRIFIRN